MTTAHTLLLLAALLGTSACAGDETGTITFTTWGEDYIEAGIPAGEDGFIDGWTVKYDKFLVNFHQLQVGTSSGEIAETAPSSYFVDNAVPGKKELVAFRDVTAKAWDRVSYQIKPAVASAVVVAGDPSDLAMMADAGYSIYVSGAASKGEVSKTFTFGFTTATQYDHCHAEQNGKDTAGIVVVNGVEDVNELTTHGDHFFYDRLQGSAGSTLETSLRFDALAAADDAGDADGEITLAELGDVGLDFELYDPSGLPVDDMREFLSGLSRTVGHFRGEGECRVSEAE